MAFIEQGLLVVIGAVLGFVSAVLAGRLEREAQERRQARDNREEALRRIRVPLEIMLQEIQANANYYLRPPNTEGMLDRLREQVYAVRDALLTDIFERAYLMLRTMGIHGAESNRHDAQPHVRALLDRIRDLEAALK